MLIENVRQFAEGASLQEPGSTGTTGSQESISDAPLYWTDLGEAASGETSIFGLIGIPGGKIVGGTYGSGTPYLFKYDIAASTFTPKMQIPGPGSHVARLAQGPGTQVYVSTSRKFGKRNLASYDPESGILANLGTFGDEYGEALAVGSDGKVYVGSCCQGKLSIYDPHTGSWAYMGTIIPDQRRLSGLTVGLDGNIYGVTSRIWVPPYGGAILYKFDPASQSTTVIETIWPGERESWNIVTNARDGRLYGSVGYGMTARLFVFDPANPQLGIEDLGATVEGADEVSAGALAIASDGKVYAVVNPGVCCHMVVYDPFNPSAGIVDLGPVGEGHGPLAFGTDGRLYGTSGNHLLRSNAVGGGGPTYATSGRVVDGNGYPIAGVTISANGGYWATTDADGRYSLSGLPAGEYALRAAKTSFVFTPETLNVTLDRDRVNQNFRGRAIACAVPLAEPFLEFPVRYGSDMTFSRALMDTHEGGLINSWFDHDKPTYQADANERVTLYNGLDYSKVRGNHVWGGLYCYDGRCYDGHDGLDIVRPDPESTPDPPVYAAAAGRVARVCVGSTCGALGNQVWINHGNNYATVYGHLKSVDVQLGHEVSSGQQLGIMGTTGNSTGVHLHFGVYFNRNLRDPWITDKIPALPEEVVDPLAWKGRELASAKDDPWETPSVYLWRESREDNRIVDPSGGTLSTPGGLVTVQLPPGALTGETMLSLGEAPVYEPSAQLRSTGISFWFRRILEVLGLTGQATAVTTLAQEDSLSLPATIVADYESASLKHLDENSLALYHWDDASGTWVPLAGTVDAEARQVSVQTSDLGFFDLQAPLLCPAETQEPDDSYYSAQELALGEPVSRLLDIPDDEDWFSLLAEAGKDYVLETRDLAEGVDTVLEIYDLGGVSLLASDGGSGGPGGSRLVWEAPADGTYFVRVLPPVGSATGCNASYSLGVTAAPADGGGTRLYLPLILRNR